MKNPIITAALHQVCQNKQAEETFTKICLIEDIMKAKRLLFGFGQIQHNEFLTPDAHAELFDELYELDIIALEVVSNGYAQQITEIAKARIMA